MTDTLRREHVLQVEPVQLEQEAIARCLDKHHGLKRVLVGLTATGVAAHREGNAEYVRVTTVRHREFAGAE